ncbi:protease PrsW [Oleomonas cavernae]|uniref:Protease PrsW n=1 Tax=Oleomonas cavernae TaxID=2320859 RepID=A0A418WAF5_9PROT|nr:PrsW family intramembrane metalloprotease [Oleomonas cavernae]RJF86936.1 protease PrsW [Oleomonas cavernae]
MGPVLMIAAAVVPSLLILRYFVKSDRFPEPTRAILGTFFLGVLIVIPVLVVALPLGAALEPRIGQPLALAGVQAFLLAAIPEEAFKLAVLLLYCRRHKAFDEPMDGLVYGVTASLGFATLENLLYVVGGGEGWIGIAVLRAFTAVPGHAVLGAIMGFYVARARFEPERAGAMLWAAFLVPMALHGLYDFGLLGAALTEEAGWIGLGLIVLIVEVVWALRLQRRLRREQQVLLSAQAAATLAQSPTPPVELEPAPRSTSPYKID